MEELIGLIGLAIVLFASTNVDDVFVLLGFFSDKRFRTRQVIIGQYVGIGALFAISVIASLISLVIPAVYIGLLGLAPIFLGFKHLWETWAADSSQADPENHDKASVGHGNIVAVSLVTMANGGDNISIYTPIFAARTMLDIVIIGMVFVLMTAIWIGTAHYLTNHPTLGAPIRRYGRKIVPFVLIALGIFILYEAGTFQLITRLGP